jgi:hypothetical protein
LVDLQGERYIYSTLFLKINWSVQEVSVPERSSAPGKLERKSKQKVRLAKTEEASRSVTSLDSSASSAFSTFAEEAARVERELGKIYEDSETKDL